MEGQGSSKDAESPPTELPLRVLGGVTSIQDFVEATQYSRHVILGGPFHPSKSRRRTLRSVTSLVISRPPFLNTTRLAHLPTGSISPPPKNPPTQRKKNRKIKKTGVLRLIRTCNIGAFCPLNQEVKRRLENFSKCGPESDPNCTTVVLTADVSDHRLPTNCLSRDFNGFRNDPRQASLLNWCGSQTDPMTFGDQTASLFSTLPKLDFQKIVYWESSQNGSSPYPGYKQRQ